MIEFPKFPPLNLPPFDIKTKVEAGIVKIFDPLRDKYVTLTPEEYVRQHFVNYLKSEFGYPASVMANEIGIELNGTRKRCDTVIFGNDKKPLVIIEYKAPGVDINQTVFDQIVRYNIKLHARYLIVSNGLRHFCCRLDYEKDTYHFLPRIPDYSSVSLPFSSN